MVMTGKGGREEAEAVHFLVLAIMNPVSPLVMRKHHVNYRPAISYGPAGSDTSGAP